MQYENLGKTSDVCFMAAREQCSLRKGSGRVPSRKHKVGKKCVVLHIEKVEGFPLCMCKKKAFVL